MKTVKKGGRLMQSWYGFYKKYFMEDCASFKGRLSRQEYLCRQILLMLSTLLPGTILFFVILRGRAVSLDEVWGTWSFVFAWCCIIVLLLVMLATNLSLMVRRLHDLDYSGWWVLLMLVPIVNTLLPLWLWCAKGTQSGNNYGVATTVVNKDVFWDVQVNWQHPLTSISQYLLGGAFIKDYFTFRGRLTCREYFFFVMAPFAVWSIVLLVGQVFYVAWLMFVGTGSVASGMGIVGENGLVVMNLVIILLLFTVDVRRSHDHGTGWYYSLLALIPFVNFIYMIRQFCLTGEEHDNKYGRMRTYTDVNGVIYNDDY